jgi:CheY-like chemotaxis protein/tetratricopeptide (TPR) repeat protein
MAATVLCADDDRHLCQILEKALMDEGYRVIVAHDGEQVLAAVTETGPELMLLNVSLPRCDGFQVLEKIRGMPDPLGQVPVLLVSNSRPTPQYQERAQALGAQALLAKPVPLKQLLARVEDHLKLPVRSAPGPEKAPRPVQEQIPVAGDLAEFDLSQLLHGLHGLRATGVLLVSSGKKRKAIQLRDGCPIAVKSNLVNECLGNYLVRQGKLSREDLAESLRRMKKGEGLQGQILVAMQVIDEEEIARTLRVQAKAKLCEIFAWTRGSFRFEMGGRLKSANTLALDTGPADVIIQGIRNGFPLERVDSYLSEWGESFVARGQSSFYRLQDIELSPQEEEFLAGLDGSCRLSEITGAGERARRTLYGLLITEMLELRSAPDGERIVPQPLPSASPRVVAEASPAPAPAPAPGADGDRALRVELAAMAEELRAKSYFEMLRVSETAEGAALDEAYEALARKAHPDRFSHASDAVRQLADEVFQLLTEARDTLSHPKRRTEYLLERRKGERAAAQRAEGERALTAEMQYQQGEQLIRQRDYEGALLCFGKAVENYPEEGEYHAHYGWVLYLCNPDNSVMVEEAIEHVTRGVKLARDREKPYLFLGRLYKVVGKVAAAEQMFTRAVQIRPDCVEAMRELRLINMRRDKSKGLIGRFLRR